jgi:hypothetical protein
MGHEETVIFEVFETSPSAKDVLSADNALLGISQAVQPRFPSLNSTNAHFRRT